MMTVYRVDMFCPESLISNQGCFSLYHQVHLTSIYDITQRGKRDRMRHQSANHMSVAFLSVSPERQTQKQVSSL